MVARGAGDVGCAHCTVIGADRSCQVCTRLVCESCGADWTTCPEPTGREIRLGRTARLRDVDPTGRIGLVTKWVGPMRLFDLRRLRWVDVALPRHSKVHETQILERLSPTGELYSSHYSWVANENTQFFDKLERRSLVTSEWLHVDTDLLEPSTGAGMTKDGHYYYVSSTQLVVVVAPDGTVRSFQPLPRRVVQAVHVNVETGILVSASWGEIAMHRISGNAIAILDRVRTTGNASWVRFEPPWLAACIGGMVRVWHVSENLAIGSERFQHVVGDPIHTADVSRDGRYLAIGANRKVIVHDLQQDVVAELEDHSDDVCLVRFAGVDQLLITADEDNRVVLRPRTPTGYVRTLIEFAVPDESIPLDLVDDINGR